MSKKLDQLEETFIAEIGQEDPVQNVVKRFDDMKAARQPFQDDWDISDLQFEAKTFEDPITGELIVNSNVEQQLLDMELGRTAADLIYDVKPKGYRVDTQKLEEAKYIIGSFIEKENFYDEYRRFKTDKGKYGTSVWFTGLRFEVEYVQEVEGDINNTDIGSGFFSKQYKETRKENWFFTPQNIPIRSVFFDDRAIYQSDINKVEDAIIIETLSRSQAKAKYGDVKEFDQDALEEPLVIEDSPAYGVPVHKGMMVLYHYYNKTTKAYTIVVNRKALLYDGKMPYNHGKLPLDICQHYPNTASLYGIGICHRVRVWKAYKNNMAQTALRGARLSSGKMVALGNGGEIIDSDFFIPAGGIGIARMTNAITDVRDIDTRVDISGQINIMNIIDNEIREATGIDLKAPFEASDETLGQTEIREQNKAIRYKAVDELMQLSLDRVLTAMLYNIKQFAPQLLKTKKIIKDKETGEKLGQVKSQRPTIQIPNVSIIEKDGVSIIKEDMGNYGYLELSPDKLDGEMTVTVVTPATNNSVLTAIEKNKFTELTNNLQVIANVYGVEKVMELFPLDQVVDKMRVVYGYDTVTLTADSKKDKKRKENEKSFAELQQQIQETQQILSAMGSNEQANITGEIPPMPTGESNITGDMGLSGGENTGATEIGGVLQPNNTGGAGVGQNAMIG